MAAGVLWRRSSADCRREIISADPVAAMMAAPFADQGAVVWILVAACAGVGSGGGGGDGIDCGGGPLGWM